MSSIKYYLATTRTKLTNFRRRRPYLFTALAAALSVGLLCVVVFVAALLYVKAGKCGEMPDRTALLAYRNNVGSEAFDRNGESLGRFYAEDRIVCKYEDLPEHLVHALVDTEDSRFYQHGGIDWWAYGRVAWKTLLKGNEDQGGGSTITQQLVKNAYGRPAVGFHRHVDLALHKMREAILARRLEQALGKEAVIERYLNTVSFPGNTFGIASAAKRYFQKTPAELTISEAACLVASLKGNTLYDPRRNPAANRKRALRTLDLMAAAGHLSPEELSAAKKDEPTVNFYREPAYAGLAPHFTEAVRMKAQEILDEIPHPTEDRAWNLYTDNLRIRTTLDLRYQAHAEAALKTQLARHQARFARHLGQRDPWATDASLRAAVRSSGRWRSGRAAGLDSTALAEVMNTPYDMELAIPGGEPLEGKFTPLDSIRHHLLHLRAGFLALDHQDGSVRAWVGGPDFDFSRYDHVTGRRQTGSTFKPFVYAAAIKDGYDPCHTLNNDLKSYGDEDGTWTPRNASGEYGGRYSMHGALSHSINTAAVRMILETGADKVVRMAKDLGITGEIPAVPSIALGTVDGTLLEMVGAYTPFANGGTFSEPYYISSIETRDGTPVYVHETERRRVLETAEAETMLTMLRYVVDRGTAGRLRWQHDVRLPSSGKTGTTQNAADGWYIGSTPALTGGAWVGGENPGIRFRSGNDGNGSRSALPIWADFVKRMTADSTVATDLGVNFPPVSARVKASFYCPEYEPDEEEMLLKLVDENFVPVDDETMTTDAR